MDLYQSARLRQLLETYGLKVIKTSNTQHNVGKTPELALSHLMEEAGYGINPGIYDQLAETWKVSRDVAKKHVLEFLYSMPAPGDK